MKYPCKQIITLLLAGLLLEAARTPPAGTPNVLDSHPRFWIPYFAEMGIDPQWARELNNKILWGYIDRSGQFVIPPKFDAAGDFTGDSAQVREGKRSFYINQLGEAIAAENLKAASDNPEAVEKKIKFDIDIFDSTGSRLISAKAKDLVVYEFSNGLAKFSMPMLTIEKLFPDCFSKTLFAKETDGWNMPAARASLFGYINENGHIIIPPRYFMARQFKDGLARVQMEVPGGGIKEGFIDTTGHLVDGKLHTQVFPFQEGFAVVEDISNSGMCRSIINTHGRVIADNLDEARNFQGGNAAVKKRDRWTLINAKGMTVRALPYEEVKAFSNDMALVTRGTKKGYIDTRGRLAIPANFVDARSFSTALAAAAVKSSIQDKLDILAAQQDWKVGFIDTRGNLVISPHFISARFFKDGLAPVRAGLKWGYIDRTGRFKIKPKFDDALSFSEGLACVRIGEDWGFIDKHGKFVIQPKFKSALKLAWSNSPLGSFCEGMALAQGTGGSYRYIDRHGRCCVPCTPCETVTERNNNFHDGLALSYMGLGKMPFNDFGYIDKNGSYVLKGFGGSSGPFSEGLAMVSRNQDNLSGQKIGYIDRSGKYVVEPEYYNGRPFREGLAAVAHGKRDLTSGMLIIKWGFIDKVGHAITEKIYDETRDFSSGFAAVKSGEKWGFIDRTGETVVAPIYDYVEDYSNDLALVKSHNRYSYIDKTGKPFASNNYWLASSFSDGLALVVFPKDKDATVTTDKSLAYPSKRGLVVKDLINGKPERN